MEQNPASGPEKWSAFSKRELCVIHHACGMLLKRPDLSREERLDFQMMEAEAWAEHCRRLAERKKIGTTVHGQWLFDFVVRNLPNICTIGIISLAVFIVLRLA